MVWLAERLPLGDALLPADILRFMANCIRRWFDLPLFVSNVYLDTGMDSANHHLLPASSAKSYQPHTGSDTFDTKYTSYIPHTRYHHDRMVLSTIVSNPLHYRYRLAWHSSLDFNIRVCLLQLLCDS